jgi:hypothetical protein
LLTPPHQLKIIVSQKLTLTTPRENPFQLINTEFSAKIQVLMAVGGV